MLFSPIQNSHFDLPFLIDPDKHIFLDAEVGAWILEVGESLCYEKGLNETTLSLHQSFENSETYLYSSCMYTVIRETT